MYRKLIEDFETIQLIQSNVMVEWNWVGKGITGEYQENDPDDVPLLSFTICSCPNVDTSSRHWEPISNASYGTQIHIDTPRTILEKLAQKIMDKVYNEIQAGNSIKETCQELCRIQNEGCPQCGSEEGYTGKLVKCHSARFDSKGNWMEDLGCDDSGSSSGPYICCDCDVEFDELPGK